MIARTSIDSRTNDGCQILGRPERAGAGDTASPMALLPTRLITTTCVLSRLRIRVVRSFQPSLLPASSSARPDGRVLDAYIVGFEIECRLGSVMNPRHYHERGWHCTSSIGTLGAAAAASRVLGLDGPATAHAIGIAASAACGRKENIGAMVKPLHAGMAARNGVMAARLAQEGFTASERAIDGPQGYLAAMDSQRPASALADELSDLGSRWEIIDTGITVKLYPSCAATHPPLGVLSRRITTD